jgi:hypothetical protein
LTNTYYFLNGQEHDQPAPAILNGILSLKLQNFAVKSISKNRFTFAKKNSEWQKIATLCFVNNMFHKKKNTSNYLNISIFSQYNNMPKIQKNSFSGHSHESI